MFRPFSKTGFAAHFQQSEVFKYGRRRTESKEKSMKAAQYWAELGPMTCANVSAQTSTPTRRRRSCVRRRATRRSTGCVPRRPPRQLTMTTCLRTTTQHPLREAERRGPLPTRALLAGRTGQQGGVPQPKVLGSFMTRPPGEVTICIQSHPINDP